MATNTHLFETKFSDRMQVTRYSTPVYASQVSFEERANLVSGSSVVRPTFAKLYAYDYTRGTDMTLNDMTETTETLNVTTAKSVAARVDNLDELQHKAPLMNRMASDAMKVLEKSMDKDYLAETANATSSLDDGDLGGVSGNPISVDSSNVLQVYTAALRKLQLKDTDITGGTDPRPQAGNMKPGGQAGFANCNPYFHEQLTYALGGRETAQGDQVGLNGYMSKYTGFDNYVTTNGYWTGRINIATNPSEGDTVVINGVTFTFNAAPAAAGSVDIGGTAAASVDNLVAALTNSAGYAAGAGAANAYYEVSDANRKLLDGVSATDGTTYIDVAMKGHGYVAVSETFTDLTDAWSLETSHQLFGQKGAVDMVVQKKPSVMVSDVPLQLAVYVKPHCLYGLKTFTEGADALVDVQINSVNWA
jgi:hypothetical protein